MVRRDWQEQLRVILRHPDLKLNLVHNQSTSLSLAVKLVRVETVRLLAHDPRLNVMTILNSYTQENVLHQLVHQCRTNHSTKLVTILMTLLAHPSVQQLDSRNHEGYSPLGLALLLPLNSSGFALRSHLLQHSAQPTNLGGRLLVALPSISYSQNTYYHMFALVGSVWSMKILLGQGGQPWVHNVHGLTATDLARNSDWVTDTHFKSIIRMERQFEWGVFLHYFNDPQQPWYGLTNELLSMIQDFLFIQFYY